jgi:hypothetical protein
MLAKTGSGETCRQLKNDPVVSFSQLSSDVKLSELMQDAVRKNALLQQPCLDQTIIY